jgi:hypothetical protein
VISGANYPNPVFVNGYECWNCTQVDEAKKHINPADPKAGPFGIDATNGAGSQSGASTAGGASTSATPPGVGGRLDISV